ncbi:peptidase [Desulfurococcus amylolyticus]|uniref:peptidase n=1 Tax=Desulfurococcus amylolyticus TaxID=94694 RepID=UPI0005B1E2B0|nr:peptidase [Desulfurococcus amylolyticus]
MIKEVMESLRRNTRGLMTLDVLNMLTRHHRIQGSSGLENALMDLREILEGLGYSTRMIEIPSDSRKGFIDTPVSWDIDEAFLQFKTGGNVIEEYRFNEHPTLVAAHSPPGEGCGVLSLCSGGKCEGEVVLTKGPAYEAYIKADARLVLVYDSKRYSEAVPYMGLFLHSDEVKDKVVMNIPYKTALKLMSMLIENPGRKIEVCWSSRTRYTGKPMHALIACNKYEEPGIVLVSHICHPKPGAHDNASGSVVNYMAAFASRLTGLEVPLCHVWVPEHTGTVFLDNALPWQPLGVINLDMVGSKQWVTGSTLNIVNTPLYMESMITPYMYLAVKAVFDTAQSFGGFNLPGVRYSLSPYTVGSDHDIFISWGLDTVMLNEWPSKYYHTDMDTVETLSQHYLQETTVASLLATLLAYRKLHGNEVSSVFRDYLKTWYAIEAVKTGFGTSLGDLSRVIDGFPKLRSDNIVKLPSPISTRSIRGILGFETYKRVSEIKGALTYLSLYAPLAYVNGLNNVAQLFQVENLIKWSSEEETLINNAWELIRNKLLK